jgi:ribA/ribD-fused uncharacterized protein
MSDTIPSYAVHDAYNIKGFFGEYRFLSNFWICPVMYDRMFYQSIENAYQASKCKPEYRFDFLEVAPKTAKHMWKNYPSAYEGDEWRDKNFDIMAGLVFDKFHRNLELRQKLLNTGSKYLEELNDWGDGWWGVDVKKKRGQNKLGFILMATRTFWERANTPFPAPADLDFGVAQGSQVLNTGLGSVVMPVKVSP